MGRWSRRKRGQRAELAVGDLLAHQAASERTRVDERVAEARVAASRQGGVEERDVEPQVVADEHAPADELDQRRQHLLDARRGHDHRLGDARQERDRRGDGDAGIDEGLKRAEALAAAETDRADLGDAAVGGRAAGGLEVDDAERDGVQRTAEVVEGSLTSENPHPKQCGRTSVRRARRLQIGHYCHGRVVGKLIRYRCTGCGNLTRFDVVTSRRSRAFITTPSAVSSRSRTKKSSPKSSTRSRVVGAARAGNVEQLEEDTVS